MNIIAAFPFWRAKVAKNPMVEIKTCSDPQMWYAKRVGEFIPVEKVDRDGLWAREPGGYLNIIRFEDV